VRVGQGPAMSPVVGRLDRPRFPSTESWVTQGHALFIDHASPENNASLCLARNSRRSGYNVFADVLQLRGGS
jgi:hypothetical protein